MNKLPQWELNAPELIFPLNVLGATVYAHMKPYDAHAMKELLSARSTRLASKAANILETKESGKSDVVRFFWKHFGRLSGPGIRKADGSELSFDEQKAIIENNPRFDIPRTAVLGGYGGIGAEEVEGGTLLDLASGTKVATFQTLYIPDLGREERVNMLHLFRPETEQDNMRYLTATGSSRIFTKRQEFERVTNFDTVGQIYDDMIIEIKGMTIDGEPCSQSNKEKWVGAVPFWHKDFVLGELFRGAQAKNA